MDVVEPEQLMRSPVVAFTDGSHIHLDRTEVGLCTESDLRQYRLLDLWRIPAPDFGLLDHNPALFTQFGQELFQQLSRYLLGTQKAIDFFACHKSGVGKSTMCEALAAALPGMIMYIDGKGATGAKRTERFTPDVELLTMARMIIFDESGKLDIKLLSKIISYSAAVMNIERKHENAINRPRIGGPWMVGDVLPELDQSVQGVSSRIGNLVEIPEETLDTITLATRELWLSGDEVARLRAWMLFYAMDANRRRDDPPPWEDAPNRQELLGKMRPPPVKVLHEYFTENTDPGSWTATKEIVQVLESAGLDKPKGGAMRRLMLSAFPNAVAKHKGEGNGWAGVDQAVPFAVGANVVPTGPDTSIQN